MEITKIMAMCMERQGFQLFRSTTGEDHIFIHFLSPAEVFLKNEWIKVKKGACVFWRCDSHQEYRSPEIQLLHDYFHVKKNENDDFSKILERYGLEFETVYYPADNIAVTETVQQIEIEILKKQAFYKELCDYRLHDLLITLARCTADNDKMPVDGETYKRFQQLRRQFHQEFNKNWTVSDMASAVNLSPSRFYSLYKQIFGISPKKDFLQIRIEHSKKLMLQGNHSIREIAELSGYNNQYHFIRQFREVTGTTPGKFIKNQNRY